MRILVGADPEVFVKKGKDFVCAEGLIPGTKEEPYRVPDGAVQVDGMALEFNIDPAETEDQFAHNILSVLNQLREMVPGYTLSITPTATFSKEVFDAASPTSKILGCDPDFNAYTGEQNPRPDNNQMFRTAAGHVHIGFTEGVDPYETTHFQRCITLVKHLDAYLGIPSVLWDADKKRRAMYGCAGAFRPKNYGVEYRTLSNAWLKDERLIRYVFRQSVRAVQALMEGERFDPATSNMFATVVNTSSVRNVEILTAGVLGHLEKPPVLARAA